MHRIHATPGLHLHCASGSDPDAALRATRPALLYFFLPPEDRSGELRTPDAGDLAWEYLVLLVWGHGGNFADVAERAAPWGHVSPTLVPRADVLDPEPDDLVLRLQRNRDRLRPEDILAVAFNGMARHHIRGSFVGKDLEELASNLRRLAQAFEALNNYPPGTFFDVKALREIADAGSGHRGDEGAAPE